jgi:hypothetical protein
VVRDEKVERNQINTQEMENNKQKLGCVCVCVLFFPFLFWFISMTIYKKFILELIYWLM